MRKIRVAHQEGRAMLVLGIADLRTLSKANYFTIPCGVNVYWPFMNCINYTLKRHANCKIIFSNWVNKASLVQARCLQQKISPAYCLYITEIRWMDGVPGLWLQYVLGCLLCDFSSVWVWSISLWWSWTCRALSHFLMVFYPSLGSCKFILKVSILRDVIITWELSGKTRLSLKVAGRFWLISPLIALVSFPHETQAAKEKVSPLPSWLSAEEPCRNRNSSAFSDLVVWKASGLSHSIGPVALLLPWYYQSCWEA